MVVSRASLRFVCSLRKTVSTRVLFELALPFDGLINFDRRHLGFLNYAVGDYDDIPTRKEVQDAILHALQCRTKLVNTIA
jgi:hypothetical protein